MNDKEIFAKNLKMYMDINGKDRNDMCNALGFNYFTFTDWIKARKMPRMDKVQKLADYFGIKKADLIEEHISEDDENKGKFAVELTHRLANDEEFKEIVKKVACDQAFYDLNSVLRKLDDRQLEDIMRIAKHMI